MIGIKRAADIRRWKRRKIIDEKRIEQDNNAFLRNPSTGSKGATFVILKNTQARLSEKKDESDKQSKERGQPKYVYEKEPNARQSQKLWRSRS